MTLAVSGCDNYEIAKSVRSGAQQQKLKTWSRVPLTVRKHILPQGLQVWASNYNGDTKEKVTATQRRASPKDETSSALKRSRKRVDPR
jgi:hypothetical protein